MPMDIAENEDRRYFYVYDRDEGTLALAEQEAVTLSAGGVVAHGVVEGVRAVDCAMTGFLRIGAQLLAKGRTLDELLANVGGLGLRAQRYRIVAEPIPRTMPGDHRAIRAVAAQIDGRADLRNPQQEFLLVISADGFWFGRRQPRGRSGWEQFGQRPRPFCNSVPLRLACAAIGLSSQPGESVYDPCCGSGTIPFLAWRMGRVAHGTDLSWPAVAMARENLAYLDCPIAIRHADARATEQRASCIITNPPYDLYCPVQESTVPAMMARFRQLAPLVTVITAMNLDKLVTDLGYTVEQAIRVRRHDFGRTIYLLRSSDSLIRRKA